MSLRPSPLAGRWYPAQPKQLTQDIQQYLGPVSSQTYDEVLGLMVPHAGLRYSGPVAGQAFRHLTDRTYDLVVIISPSHHPYNAKLVTSAHHAYQTPLGTVPIAEDLRDELIIRLDALPIENDPEHGIEIELPFLQYLLSDFLLLPVAMIDQSKGAARALAATLNELLVGQRVLLVASSDLSHFYHQSLANQLDATLLERVIAKNGDGVIHADTEGKGFACGRGAIATVLHMLHATYDNFHATQAAYATSGNVSGDFSRVVGYGAVSFHR